MSNKYTDGLDQRYIQNFQGKDDDGNVKGSFGRSDRGRYDAYAKATKGLDKDLAFKALDGGMTFGDSDRARYNKLVSDRDSAAKTKAQADAKAKAQAQAAAKAKAQADANAKSQADAKAKAQADANAKEQAQAQAQAKAKAQAHQQSSSIVKKPETKPDVNTSTGTGSSEKAVGKAESRIDTSQQQTVTQDNDINTTVTGNQNTVVNNQDNSIRQYGGNTKVFNYQGKGNSGVDTPVSSATMAGYYDTDDSPAATAKFFDMHNTLFQDAQKKFSGKGKEIASMYSNFDARGYDPGKLDSRIENSKLRSYDRATLAANDLFGDQERYRGHRPEYKFGKGPDPIEND